MATAARERLARALRGDSETAFSTEGISRFPTSVDGDPVTILQLATLRAALSAGPAPVPGNGLGELAADCAARLRGRLGQPRRDADDWSVILSAGGCACELCGSPRDFLAAADQRTLQWPLAEQGRRHVHSRIDGAGRTTTRPTTGSRARACLTRCWRPAASWPPATCGCSTWDVCSKYS